MAKLYWTGDVGFYNPDTKEGITVAKIKADLDASAGQPIEVELTTFGGDYFQAAPALNLLQSYPGQRTVYLNGIVASAGTVIAMGFDKVIARPTSMFMIHNAQGLSYGDHNAFRKDADRQEKMSNMVAELYAKKTGKKLEEVKAWMDGEGDGTWFMGQEIVDAGFADEMENTDLKASSMMLLSAQAQFKDRVTMWAKAPSVTLEDRVMSASKAKAQSLIDSKDIDYDSPWSFSAADGDALLGANGDDWANYKLWHLVQDTEATQNTKDRFKYPYGKNGKIYRSALRSIASRAATQNLQDLSDWASAKIKEIDAGKENKVDKQAVLAYLKDNPIPLQELAGALGQVNMLVTEDHTKAIAEVVTLKAELKAREATDISNAITAEFGPEKLENGVANELRAYAVDMLAGVTMANFKEKVEEFKKKPVALRLASERMDVNSEQNVFRVEGSGKPEFEQISMGARVRVV